MSRLTSSERRGTIILITLTAVIIAIIFASRCSFSGAPDTAYFEPRDHTVTPDSTFKSDSITTTPDREPRRIRKSHRKKHKKFNIKPRHQRDHLSEPI